MLILFYRTMFRWHMKTSWYYILICYTEVIKRYVCSSLHSPNNIKRWTLSKVSERIDFDFRKSESGSDWRVENHVEYCWVACLQYFTPNTKHYKSWCLCRVTLSCRCFGLQSEMMAGQWLYIRKLLRDFPLYCINIRLMMLQIGQRAARNGDVMNSGFNLWTIWFYKLC